MLKEVPWCPPNSTISSSLNRAAPRWYVFAILSSTGRMRHHSSLSVSRASIEYTVLVSLTPTETEGSLGFEEDASWPLTRDVERRQVHPYIVNHELLLAILKNLPLTSPSQSNQFTWGTTERDATSFMAHGLEVLALTQVVERREISDRLYLSFHYSHSSTEVHLPVDLESTRPLRELLLEFEWFFLSRFEVKSSIQIE